MVQSSALSAMPKARRTRLSHCRPNWIYLISRQARGSSSRSMWWTGRQVQQTPTQYRPALLSSNHRLQGEANPEAVSQNRIFRATYRERITITWRISWLHRRQMNPHPSGMKIRWLNPSMTNLIRRSRIPGKSSPQLRRSPTRNLYKIIHLQSRVWKQSWRTK